MTDIEKQMAYAQHRATWRRLITEIEAARVAAEQQRAKERAA